METCATERSFCAMSRTMIIEASKNAFIEALFQLLKSESFEHITVKQLTLESGYSKRTYY